MGHRDIPTTRLVKWGADYDGVKLDIYADLDEDGYTLSKITLNGSGIDLIPVLSSSVVKTYERWVEMNMPSPAELRASVKAQARLDRHEWDREFRIS